LPSGAHGWQERFKVLDIFIDADGCPVKQEVYRVAQRYGLHVTVVANSRIRIPYGDWVKLVVVEGQFDAVDDWIVEHVAANDIVVSGDIPLAARCLDKGALVLGLRGDTFTQDSIGEALASRALLAHLRELGTITGGPAPFENRDRSRFLQRLDETIQAVRRRG
jgi:uncharacterized protein YaiI (UPF0178 family)